MQDVRLGAVPGVSSAGVNGRIAETLDTRCAHSRPRAQAQKCSQLAFPRSARGSAPHRESCTYREYRSAQPCGFLSSASPGDSTRTAYRRRRSRRLVRSRRRERRVSVADSSAPRAAPLPDPAPDPRKSYSRFFGFRRFAACALVALLQRRCSGARGSVRSRSSWPRSQGSSGRINSPHRRHGTTPKTTCFFQRSRSAR